MIRDAGGRSQVSLGFARTLFRNFGRFRRFGRGRNKLGFHNWFVSFLPQQDLPSTEPNAQIAMAIFTYDSSATLCELCLNPAVGISQRIYEAYVGTKK